MLPSSKGELAALAQTDQEMMATLSMVVAKGARFVSHPAHHIHHVVTIMDHTMSCTCIIS